MAFTPIGGPIQKPTPSFTPLSTAQPAQPVAPAPPKADPFNPFPTTSSPNFFTDQWNAGQAQIDQAFQQQGATGKTTLSGALAVGAGVATKATAFLAPIFAPISAAINKAGDLLSNTPFLQAYGKDTASLPADQQTAPEKLLTDIVNAANAGLAILGGAEGVKSSFGKGAVETPTVTQGETPRPTLSGDTAKPSASFTPLPQEPVSSPTTASKPSTADVTSIGNAPTGKEGVSAPKADTSGPFMGVKVYHGTDAEFSKFDDAALASNPNGGLASKVGHWFSDDPEWAKNHGANIKEVSINLKNPKVYEPDQWGKLIAAKVDFPALRKQLQAQGFDGIYIKEKLTPSANNKLTFRSPAQWAVFDARAITPSNPGNNLLDVPTGVNVKANPAQTNSNLLGSSIDEKSSILPNTERNREGGHTPKSTTPSPSIPKEVITPEKALSRVHDMYEAVQGTNPHFPEGSKADGTLQEIKAEMLELAHAGRRIIMTDDQGLPTGEVRGESSAFPQWVPEELRSSDLFRKVLDGVDTIRDLKYPPARNVRQRALVNVIHERLDSRLGVETGPLRDQVMQGVTSEEPLPEPDGGTPTGEAPFAQKPSKIGKSIEAKAVEAKLTEGFDKTAGYDPTTFEEQGRIGAELTNSGVDNLRAVIAGEKPLPEGLREEGAIAAAETYLEQHPDAELSYALANSPLTTETSYHAQGLSIARMRTPDSITAKYNEIKAARKAAIEKRSGSVKKAVKKLTDDIQKEIKTTASKRPTWETFIKELTCNS